MTLDEAIRDLKDRVSGEFNIEGKDDCADMKLGIEALKLVREMRQPGVIVNIKLLPGETED
jgi:hypothetical protein